MRKIKTAVLMSAVAVLIFGGGFAAASIPSSGGVINACYKNTGGDLRVYDSAAGGGCSQGWTPINWRVGGLLHSPRIVVVTYTVPADSEFSNVGNSVVCGPNERALSAGWINPSAANVDIITFRPFTGASGVTNEWRFIAHNYGSIDADVRLDITCASITTASGTG